jgi:pimeloyl-ACP methyl ester carboxylesterase
MARRWAEKGIAMTFTEAPGGTLVHVVDLDLHSDALHAEVNEPVILIHGLGCNWRHWCRQIGWLAHSRRVIVPDVRCGAGKTRWDRPRWSTADKAADIHAITVHLGLRRPAIARISMGGTIALQYALDYPADLGCMVLIDSFPGVPAEFAAADLAAHGPVRSGHPSWEYLPPAPARLCLAAGRSRPARP